MKLHGYVFAALGATALASVVVACSGQPGAAMSQDGTTLAEGRQQLSGHLTPEMQHARIVGRVPAAAQMSVTLGLSVPDHAALDAFAKGVSDPASPTYRQYLSPEQFGETFGASAADYQAVLDWARAKNLQVEAHPNRLTAHLTGAVADLEAAFAVHFSYALRADGTQFHVVDAEPSLDLAVPVEHISNLENFVLPRPALGGGSGPGGIMTGYDFRHAYAFGTSLTGAGQTIGIAMLGGVLQSDVDAYAKEVGLSPTPSPIQIVSAEGNSGGIGGRGKYVGRRIGAVDGPRRADRRIRGDRLRHDHRQHGEAVGHQAAVRVL
jgi:subtilase family serine protease